LRLLALLLCWAVACTRATSSESEPNVGSEAAASALSREAGSKVRSEPAPSAAATAPARRSAPVHTLSVRSVRGELALSSASAAQLAPGSVLREPSELHLQEGAVLELALDDHAAIRLRGPARLLLLPEGEPALLVREGLVTVDCAPRSARATSSALWLATPTGRLDIVQGARFVLRARAERASELAVVSGHVDVRELGAARTLVGGGEPRCVGAASLARSKRPELAQLERAEQLLSASSACAATRVKVALAGPLTAALSALEASREQERALLAEHQRLLAEHAPQAQAVPRQLAELAAKGLGELETARALRASYEAEQLGRRASDEAESLTARARTHAPYRD